MVKSLACLLILPDLKDDIHIERWDKSVEWATNAYTSDYPMVDDMTSEKRWAIGYLAWKRLIQHNASSDVKVFFVRTDYRLQIGTHTVENDIITVGYNKSYGHIMYKTLEAFKLLTDFDFVVRGNVNTIVDIHTLHDYLEDVRTSNVFTSPFWEGGDYPYGYFMLFSKDIIEYLSSIDMGDDKRFFTEDTADDYEITKIVLTKYDHTMLKGCDAPHKHINDPKPEITKINERGMRLLSTETSAQVNNAIKESSELIFLYRIQTLADKNYVSVYKFLIRHIWNKIIKKRYSDLVVYNESGHRVPHLEYERDEQLLVSQYISPSDVVLELGARYGSVSCIINKILTNKSNQVSVEPDNTVWEALERTKRENKCEFMVYKGIISSKNYDLKLNGYGSTVDITNTITSGTAISTQNMSLDELQKTTGLTFNVLVADCEGFLETFLNENKILYTQLNLIIFECDRADVCNYHYIKTELIANGFVCLESGFQCVFKKQ